MVVSYEWNASPRQVKNWWWLAATFAILWAAAAVAEGEVWEESEHEVLIRSERRSLVQPLTATYDFTLVFRWKAY
ncbi:hypothetical protein EVAR_72710_1 [Eumeta japonica]|uniref:Uncharacterized protein n=1 Tax=Eumeta variegata TaxID=151549 RepID=A0A4C1SGG7_EUMVA|nr:hypothetical protein EVAR_72710_1 [Eumeta japonica]